MSRLSGVARERVTGAAREVLDRKVAETGRVPGIYAVFAHRPWILTTMDAHFSAVMGSGTVPHRLKEMLALQASLVHAVGQGAREPDDLAERTGAPAERIAALLDFENGPFGEAEKAALRFGRRLARDAAVSEKVFADLLLHFDEGEIVEITCVLGLSTYLSRFRQALCVPPDRAEEGSDAP